MRFFSDFLYKGICCEYSFELHGQVDAIQMSTHIICLYKEVKKKYTGCKYMQVKQEHGFKVKYVLTHEEVQYICWNSAETKNNTT